MRFHGPAGTILLWDLAHRREQALRFIWSGRAVF